MTTDEFLRKGNEEFGEVFETIVRYASGMLRRQVTDMGNCLDILEDLDDYSYMVNEG